MDTTAVISDYLDNSNIDNFSDLLTMAEDYKYRLLMDELKDEFVTSYNENDLPF